MTTGTLADGTGLLHAICAHPEDDAPRLVYADWLEERGQGERAELIRVQCALAKVPGSEWVGDEDADPQVLNLMRRERDLLFDHWPRWLHDAFGGVAYNIGASARDDNDYGVSLYGQGNGELGHFDCRFRRGFVAEVTLTLADWRRHGARLVQVAPLTRVRISDREPLHHSNSVGPFAWWDDVGIDPADDDKSDLPRDLFELLAGGHYVRNGVLYRQPRREYDTLAEAHDDLSAACLLWAKRKDSQ